MDSQYNTLLIDFGAGFVPVACLTDLSFEETNDMIGTTTRDNGGWKTSRPMFQSASISFSGISINTAFVGGDNTKASFDKLRQLKRNKTKVDWKIESIDQTSYSDSGSGFITELTTTSSIDSFISFDATIQKSV